MISIIFIMFTFYITIQANGLVRYTCDLNQPQRCVWVGGNPISYEFDPSAYGYSYESENHCVIKAKSEETKALSHAHCKQYFSNPDHVVRVDPQIIDETITENTFISSFWFKLVIALTSCTLILIIIALLTKYFCRKSKVLSRCTSNRQETYIPVLCIKNELNGNRAEDTNGYLTLERSRSDEKIEKNNLKNTQIQRHILEQRTAI